MPTLQQIGDAQYMALETFRKNGQGVVTPVWVTREGETLYVLTVDMTWKVKRINNNSRVRLAICDARGNLHSEFIEATAEVMDTPQQWQAMKRRARAKYGLMFRLFMLMGRLRKSHYVVIKIEAAPESTPSDLVADPAAAG